MGELGFELISDAKSALSLKETVAVWVGGREVGAQTELQTLGVDLRVSDNLPPERRTRPGSPRMRPRQRYWALGLGHVQTPDWVPSTRHQVPLFTSCMEWASGA